MGCMGVHAQMTSLVDQQHFRRPIFMAPQVTEYSSSAKGLGPKKFHWATGTPYKNPECSAGPNL